MERRKMMKKNALCYVFTAAAMGLTLLPVSANAKLTAKANHDHISIDTFYHGSTVSVKGEYDPGTDLVIKITSPDGHAMMKKKGKVGGVLWMNVGDLNFDHTPELYLERSTRDVADIVAREEAGKYVLGFDALQDHVEIGPVRDAAEKATFFDQFVKFKEKSNLYAANTGRIDFAEKDGTYTYYTLFDWPYQAKPGDYSVDVYEVKDGKVLETAQSKVLVEQTGAVKYLATMARSSGAMYGLVSVLVALISGFGVGAIFRKDGGAH